MTRNAQRRRAARDVRPQTPQWRWVTLPVWLALTGGMIAGWYLGTAGSGWNYEPWSFWALLIVLFLFSFGLSRIVSRLMAGWVAKRRSARQEKRILKDPLTRR
jgi:antibiotic biosynthesis monooxygenase (ABM) superfamily enzyme